MTAKSTKSNNRLVRGVTQAVARGRRPKFGEKIERQVSVGLDPERLRQLSLIREHLQDGSVSTVTESDVFRHAFDDLVASLQKEVIGLKP